MTNPTLTEKDVAEIAEPRPLDSLTKLERAWLKRRLCGWCEARGDTNTCYAMLDDSRPWLGSCCTVPELDARRAIWLASYKPRNHLISTPNMPKGDRA